MLSANVVGKNGGIGMKKYYIAFTDCEGCWGSMEWACKNISEVKKLLNNYINAWNLAPISDLEIKEI